MILFVIGTVTGTSLAVNLIQLENCGFCYIQLHFILLRTFLYHHQPLRFKTTGLFFFLNTATEVSSMGSKTDQSVIKPDFN